MSWIKSQNRLQQCYIATTARLNFCGILPDGAEIKPWILEQINEIDPPPTKLETDMILGMMWREGVKFHGVTPEARAKFESEPMFAGHKLGELKP